MSYQLIQHPFPPDKFDQLVTHPVQSWAWGEFRQSLGQTVIRVIKQDPTGRPQKAWSFTLHPLPLIGQLGWQVASSPRSCLPEPELLNQLPKLLPHSVIAINFEPDWYLPISKFDPSVLPDIIQRPDMRRSNDFYYRFSRIIDLTRSNDQLLADMKPKTRYNVRLAQRHGVSVTIDNSTTAWQNYLQLMAETTARQGFHAHDRHYHHTLWQHLHPAGIAQLLVARHQGQMLAAWMLFVWQKRLFYVYGGSTRQHRHLMASYALMWEAIQYGKQQKLTEFDVWGTLGPQADHQHPWYGFHYFKQGFGGTEVQFLGSYDLITRPHLYPIWRLMLLGRKFFLTYSNKFKPNSHTK